MSEPNDFQGAPESRRIEVETYQKIILRAKETRRNLDEANLRCIEAPENSHLARRNVNRVSALCKIDNFRSIRNTLSTSSLDASEIVDSNATIELPEQILSRENLKLIDPLDSAGWALLRDSIIKTPLDYGKGERQGIRPTVLKIIEECLSSTENCIYAAQYEASEIDDRCITDTSDISIIRSGSISKRVSRIVIPIEIKRQEDFRSSVYQSLDYLSNKLRMSFELLDSE